MKRNNAFSILTRCILSLAFIASIIHSYYLAFQLCPFNNIVLTTLWVIFSGSLLYIISIITFLLAILIIFAIIMAILVIIANF